MGNGRSVRPKLRLIVPPTPNLLDPIFREAHIRRVIHLRDAYRLHWLVSQGTFGVASLSCLEDCDLIRLLDDMEKARQCMMDGISFHDAGLVRDPRSNRCGQNGSNTYDRDLEAAEIALANRRKHVGNAIDESEPPF